MPSRENGYNPTINHRQAVASALMSNLCATAGAPRAPLRMRPPRGLRAQGRDRRAADAAAGVRGGGELERAEDLAHLAAELTVARLRGVGVGAGGWRLELRGCGWG